MKVTRGCTYAALLSLMLSEFGEVTEAKRVESEKPVPTNASEMIAKHENQHVEREKVFPETRLRRESEEITATIQSYKIWLDGFEFPGAV